MNRGIVALELLGLAVGTLALAVFWAFSTPSGMNLVLRRIVGDAPFDVTIENAALAPTASWAPSTWRVVVSGIVVAPKDASHPTIHVTRLTLSSPEFLRAWLNRDLQFADVSVVGLDVHAKHQHEPTAWTPHKTALDRLSVDKFDVWDASVHIDADGPLAEIDVRRISGQVAELVYEPATRALYGTGSLEATSFKDGGAHLVAVDIPNARATGQRLEWSGGTFTFGGGKGRLDGLIDGLNGNPTVTLTLGLVDVELGAVVLASTGREGPLAGRLSAELVVHAGGDLGRGDAWADGTMKLDDALITVGPDTKELTLKLLEAAHLAEIADDGRLALHGLSGRLRLRRGRIDILELRYTLQRRDLEAHGAIDDKTYALVLRLLPEDDPEHKPGIGVVIDGTAGQRDARLRRATDAELLGQPPPIVVTDVKEPPNGAEPPGPPRLRDRLRERLKGGTRDNDAP